MPIYEEAYPMATIQTKTVYVGLSGGVDSAVAAYLLQKQGYAVTAVFMQNWDQQACSAHQDVIDAQAVCDHLGIPLEVVNFAHAYWNEVFEQFLAAHKQGLTPNPDILCNSKIKFKHFLHYARERGADHIATGHYARLIDHGTERILAIPQDANKDQTYFLHALNQDQLRDVIFPLADWDKTEVRALAKAQQLPVYAKKDSTGICFIGNKNYQAFLEEYMLARPGDIVDDEGRLLGRHKGLIFYTLGQRKGIGLGGDNQRLDAAWYVAEKDFLQNRLVVVQGGAHPHLLRDHLYCPHIHWIGTAPAIGEALTAKIRYRQSAQDCHIESAVGGYRVVFAEPQRAVTPGQYVVFYQGSHCLGGGEIRLTL
jgi:tRNA-specific 2-thiouridylase